MKTLSTADFQRAREFLHHKARPLDWALFRILFENGPREDVWTALAAFSNPDGGFGRALEPDCRVPDSSLLATVTAFTYLEHTSVPSDHPLVRAGVAYLVDTYDHAREGWAMLPRAADEHPRAIWWNHVASPPARYEREGWYNPSAIASGVLLHHAEHVPPALLAHIAAKVDAAITSLPEKLTGHDFLSLIELAQNLAPTKAAVLWQELRRRARGAVQCDPARWTTYGLRPLWAVPTPDSPLADVLADAIHAHLDFEIEHQHPDGSWHPFWKWGRYESDWPAAQRDWQGHLTVKVLKSLQAFGRIA